MERDIDRITKNQDTDIVLRIDDFGGRVGLTIREFVKGERYTGFTKAGTRIPADKFKQFKEAINSIDENELLSLSEETSSAHSQSSENSKSNSSSGKKEESSGESDDIGEDAI